MSAREFLERELRNDPDLSFAEVQERGRRLGLNIPPFLFGSARRQLGLPARRDLVDPNAQRPVEAAEPTAPERAEVEPTPAGEDLADEELGGNGGDGMSAEEPTGTAENAPRASAAKSSAFQFAVDTLRISPDLSFQDLKTRAQMAGLKLPPIVFGRAKALLGLVPTKPRQPRKRVEPEAPRTLRQVDSAAEFQPTPPRAQPARTSTPMPSNLASLEQLVHTIRELEADRQRLQAMLTAIQSAVAEALADDES